jgi:methionine-rich copper-binding protein CopC
MRSVGSLATGKQIDAGHHGRWPSVLADLTTVVPVRYRAASAEAFARVTDATRVPHEVVSEDTASVLLRFSDGIKGSFTVAQVFPDDKNDCSWRPTASWPR